MALTQVQLANLSEVTRQALADASQTLTSMLEQTIRMEAPAVEVVDLYGMQSLLQDPTTPVTAVYLLVQGDLHGHLLLLWSTESACSIADILLGKKPGTTRELDEMDLSALAEVGNVTGTCFLNALANRTGLKILPTVPATAEDMVGAIVQYAVADLAATADEAVVVETQIEGDVKGHFLLLPDAGSLVRLLQCLEAEQ